MTNKKAYNFFTALRIERKEVIHSSMLVAIASYNDDCKNLFFDMLANKGDAQKINELRSLIDIEKYPYWINTEHKLTERVGNKMRDRGRADIWLGNGKVPSYRVIVENKIDAHDQYRQLRKYFRYLTGNGRVNAGLYYLCLNDDEERIKRAKESAKYFNTESSSEKTDYHIITYKNDITNWLKQILELKNLEPNFIKSVEQYLEIVLKISK